VLDVKKRDLRMTLVAFIYETGASRILGWRCLEQQIAEFGEVRFEECFGDFGTDFVYKFHD